MEVMSDSIGDLVSRRVPVEPPEIARIKQFVLEEYNVTPTIMLSGKNLVVSVSSAALAGTLRMRIVDLEKIAQTDKKLLIRIGR